MNAASAPSWLTALGRYKWRQIRHRSIMWLQKKIRLTCVQAVTFYSHSTVVLWWVRGHGRSFRPFVANRIGEIQMATDPSQKHHVVTEENPADLCTRGAFGKLSLVAWTDMAAVRR